MKNHILSLFFLFSLFLITTTLSQSSNESSIFSVCNRPFNCGALSNISFPFWDDVERPRYCGGRNEFKLTNCSLLLPNQLPSLQISSQDFIVIDINPFDYTIKMRLDRNESTYETCDPPLSNITLDKTLFQYTPDIYTIIAFYHCTNDVVLTNNFTCYYSSDGYKNENVFYMEDDARLLRTHQNLFQKCKNHSLLLAVKDAPLDPNPGADGGIGDLMRVVEGGFEVKYDNIIEDVEKCKKCRESKGVCGRSTGNNDDKYRFSCYCPGGSTSLLSSCPNNNSRNTLDWRRKIGIAVGAAAFGALAVSIGVYIYQRRKKNRYTMPYVQSQSFSTSDPSSIVKDPEKGSQYFGAHVFTYDELEEATNNFDSTRELGDGGFGTVYYGELHDGRRVAVKRLYENNYRRVEQFMNEVEILTGLRHPNLVSLFGCTSRHSRELLLVYEYIPNGTVADHLHSRKAKPDTVLPWHTRMNIAVETASALKYLHASEIIHRDVKTNNILLDSHFCVKVADFGLSRLFPVHATHVSTAPQGTPGYVDPEYHECYQLTSKSDVYSFGVVLIELISSLPAVDITRHRHEINLSTMAINKIHNQALHELVDPKLGFETDFKVRKMINAVAELAYRCLQSSKDMRPSMEEVLENLLDIQSDGDGKHKSQPEVLDISVGDDVVLLKDDPPPPSPDSNVVSKSTTPNASG